MKRRTLLKSLAVGPAAVTLQAQPPRQGAVDESPKLEATLADAVADALPGFFTKDEFAALRRLGDLFEPASGPLPGARDAGAAEFLDFLLSRSPAARQNLYRTGLDRLNADAHRKFNKTFAALDDHDADAVLAPLRRPWTYQEAVDPLERFLREAKADFTEATRNSPAFVATASKRSRGASGLGEYWLPLR